MTSFYREEKSERNFVGVNITPNLETQDYTPFLSLNEFEYCAKEMLEYADYLVLNLSNAKTEGLKQFYTKEKMISLIKSIQKIRATEIGYLAALEFEEHLFREKARDAKLNENQAGDNLYIYNNYEKSRPSYPHKTPLLFIKIDSGLSPEKLAEIGNIANETKLDGIIIGSFAETSKEIEEAQYEIKRTYKSGQALAKEANRALSILYQKTGGL